jgi:hypothetical protein
MCPHLRLYRGAQTTGAPYQRASHLRASAGAGADAGRARTAVVRDSSSAKTYGVTPHSARFSSWPSIRCVCGAITSPLSDCCDRSVSSAHWHPVLDGD